MSEGPFSFYSHIECSMLIYNLISYFSIRPLDLLSHQTIQISNMIQSISELIHRFGLFGASTSNENVKQRSFLIKSQNEGVIVRIAAATYSIDIPTTRPHFSVGTVSPTRKFWPQK